MGVSTSAWRGGKGRQGDPVAAEQCKVARQGLADAETLMEQQSRHEAESQREPLHGPQRQPERPVGGEPGSEANQHSLAK